MSNSLMLYPFITNPDAVSSTIYQEANLEPPIGDLITGLVLMQNCEVTILIENEIFMTYNKATDDNDPKEIEVYLPTIHTKFHKQKISVVTNPFTKVYYKIKSLNTKEQRAQLTQESNNFWNKFWEERNSKYDEIHKIYQITDKNNEVSLLANDKIKYIHISSVQKFKKISIVLNGHDTVFSNEICEFLAKKKGLDGYVIDFEENDPPYLDFKEIENTSLIFEEFVKSEPYGCEQCNELATSVEITIKLLNE